MLPSRELVYTHAELPLQSHLADEVSDALLTRLQVGVTAWTGRGMFTENEHKVLFCTVNRPGVNAVRALLDEVDPEAFVVIGHGHQARGGRVRNETPLARRDTPGA
jgi:uncharacterized membrane-anchored protein YitT (DUF2179 family)